MQWGLNATERLGRFAKVLTLKNRSWTGWTGLLCQGRNACPSAGANLRALRSLENLLGRFQAPSVFVNLRESCTSIVAQIDEPTTHERFSSWLCSFLEDLGQSSGVTGYCYHAFSSILSPILIQRVMHGTFFRRGMQISWTHVTQHIMQTNIPKPCLN